MLQDLESGDCDLVVATRYDGSGVGGVGQWSKRRVMISKVATRMAQRLTA